jgi:predicted transcriptional regulator
VFSTDRAGNENDNAAAEKESEIAFAVDKTPPVIIVSDLENGGSYNATEKTVSADIKDNMKMGTVEVRINGKVVKTDVEDNFYRFSLPASNLRQDVKILAKDAAGNEMLYDTGNFIVTTNAVVRWYYNTPLFIATIVGALAIGMFIWWLTFTKRRRRRESAE